MNPLAVCLMFQLTEGSQRSVQLLCFHAAPGNPDHPNGLVSCTLPPLILAPDVGSDTEQRGTVLNCGKALIYTQLEGSIHL